MLQQLISHSPDLKRLEDEGYDLEVCGGYLLVHHIPYVNTSKEVKYGTFVCLLTLASPTRTAQPQDHTIFFVGDTPCYDDGTPIIAIINNSNPQRLTDKILVNHFFSSKPAAGNYANYYEKVRTYTEILIAQAKAIDNSVTAKPNRSKVMQ